MLVAIKEDGYTGRIIDEPKPDAPGAAVNLEVASLKEPLKSAFERAAGENLLVLIDVHGPG